MGTEPQKNCPKIFLTFCQVRLTSVIWSEWNLLKKTNRGGLTKPTVVSVIGCSNPQVYGQTIRRWCKQLFVVAVAVPGLVKTTPFKRLRAKTGQYLTWTFLFNVAMSVLYSVSTLWNHFHHNKDKGFSVNKQASVGNIIFDFTPRKGNKGFVVLDARGTQLPIVRCVPLIWYKYR